MSRQCDQYSLAIVFQQMLTGTVPFWSTDVHQLMMKHLRDEPDLDALPAQDRKIVAKALAKNPEKRFSSCQEFLEALSTGMSRRMTRPVRQFNKDTAED